MSYFRQTANYQVSISESSVSAQHLTTGTTADVTNSQINYTPHKDAKYVIYEASVYVTKPSSYMMATFGLWNKIGGSWSEISSDYRRHATTGQANDALSDEYQLYFRFKLDTWQGERPIKMTVNNRSSYWRVSLHKTNRWEGTGTDKFIMPQFMMYSVL